MEATGYAAKIRDANKKGTWWYASNASASLSSGIGGFYLHETEDEAAKAIKKFFDRIWIGEQGSIEWCIVMVEKLPNTTEWIEVKK
jgi:hypothetical protein